MGRNDAGEGGYFTEMSRLFTTGIIAAAFVINLQFCRHSSPSEELQIAPAPTQSQSDRLRGPTVHFDQAKVEWTPYGEQRPVDIREITKVEAGPDKGDLRIEVKNISDKPIRSISLPLWPPYCRNFEMFAGLVAGLGDRPYFTKPSKQVLQPGDTDTIVVKRMRWAEFQNPTHYEGCSALQSYCVVFLSQVVFQDGSDWRPPEDPTVPPPYVTPSRKNKP